MSKIIHFIGLDVHKESVALSIAPSDSTEVRFYGTIGGRHQDLDPVIKKLQRSNQQFTGASSERTAAGRFPLGASHEAGATRSRTR